MKDNELISKQSNMFVQTTNQSRFSVMEKQLLIYCFSRMNEMIAKQNGSIDKSLLYDFEFKGKEYFSYLKKYHLQEFDNERNMSNYIYATLHDLMDKTFTLIKGEDHFLLYHLVNKCEYNKGGVLVQFEKDVVDSFVDMLSDRNFTLINFNEFYKINSKYGQRLYEFFMSYRNLINDFRIGKYTNDDPPFFDNKEYEIVGEKILKIKMEKQELYNILLDYEESPKIKGRRQTATIKDSCYTKNFFDFQRRVLDIAINSINENTNLKILYELNNENEFQKLDRKYIIFFIDYESDQAENEKREQEKEEKRTARQEKKLKALTEEKNRLTEKKRKKAEQEDEHKRKQEEIDHLKDEINILNGKTYQENEWEFTAKKKGRPKKDQAQRDEIAKRFVESINDPNYEFGLPKS